MLPQLIFHSRCFSSQLMIVTGSDKACTAFRLLTFDRQSPYNLKVSEDPRTYTQKECDARVEALIKGSGAPLERTMKVAAILGFIRLPKVFMVLVLAAQKVGSIGGRWLYSISDWKLKAIGHKQFDKARPAAVGKYKAMIMEDIELNKDFYFSYFYDLTHSLQTNLQGWKAYRPPPTPADSEPATAAATRSRRNSHTRSSFPPASSPAAPSSATLHVPTSSGASVSSRPHSPRPDYDASAFDPILNIIPQGRNRTDTHTAIQEATITPVESTTKMESLSEEQEEQSKTEDSEQNSRRRHMDRPKRDSMSLSFNGKEDESQHRDDESSKEKSSTTPPQQPHHTAEFFFKAGNMSRDRESPDASSAEPPLPPEAYHPAYAEKWLWNLHLAREFLHFLPHGSYWLVPLIHGFVQQHQARIGRRDVLVTLIARRSRHFAGTRYIKRGVSSLGHVANEVETEQIVQERAAYAQGPGAFSSLLMLRGSIPLYWAQENPKSMKPDIVVYNFESVTFGETDGVE